jgi:hypothetical protein
MDMWILLLLAIAGKYKSSLILTKSIVVWFYLLEDRSDIARSEMGIYMYYVTRIHLLVTLSPWLDVYVVLLNDNRFCQKESTTCFVNISWCF